MKLKLVRVAQANDAMMGVLCVQGSPEFVTLEDAWKQNQRQVSCIPAGTYKVLPRKSPKFGPTWQVMDVPGRDHILFHAGNTNKDTHGCILVGLQFGKIGKESAILSSRSAFLRFLDLMKDTPEAELTIVDSTDGGRE